MSRRASTLGILVLLMPVCAFAQQLVDVGGHSLDVLVRGSGTPVVVLESGHGEGRGYWTAVQEEVARFTTVIAYSRSGYGKSDYSPRTGALDTIEELRTLLQLLELEGPFVPVGHSLGGWYVRTFAAQYPEEVAGLVLVDATPDDNAPWIEAWPDYWERLDSDSAYSSWLAEGPQVVRDEELFYRQVLQGRGLPESKPQPAVPVGVVTAARLDSTWVGDTEPGMRIWREQHLEWVRNATRAIHLISDRTGHSVTQEEPELIVDAIRWVVESIRAGR